MGDFLPGDRPWGVGRWWQVGFALLVTVALSAGGVHWLSDRGRPGSADDVAPVSLAQGFADAALAAFSGSTTVTAAGSALTAGQRASGLPADPVAGLTSTTAAGPVQVVLPGGLGAAQHTTGGQVVYPDTGAGFDMLAENTGTGTRTVARINTPAGVRMVTTFVRTPADTVMLAHTNGYLTINRATPTAETVGMFSPAETRDATGALVPSSYVVKQLAPQLYVLAEVIDPRPDTVWPVYVDPPLHIGGPGGAPLPAGLFDSITSTISSVSDTVASAASTALSATVSGAKAVGTFVKKNPLESAMLVGGVALALTGVGGPASAAMIASATVNLTSAGLDIAAAAMPDNQTLANVATGFDVASALTPQGAAKNVVKEGAELAAEQLAKHADDVAEGVIDVAKTTPTPPTQLADDITAKPPLPGVGTPKAPNAPPAGPLRSPDDRIPLEPPPFGPVRPPTEYKPPSVSQPAGTRNDCGHVCDNPATIYSQEWTPQTYNNKLSGIENGQSSETVHRETDQAQIGRNRRDAQNGVPSGGRDYVLEEDNPASTKEGGQGARLTYTPKWEGNREGNQLQRTYRDQGIGDADPYDRVFRGDDGQVRCASCAIGRRNQQDAASDAARARAQANARQANNAPNQGNALKTNVSNNTQDNASRRDGHRNNKQGSNSGSKKNKTQSTNKKHRKGQK